MEGKFVTVRQNTTGVAKIWKAVLLWFSRPDGETTQKQILADDERRADELSRGLKQAPQAPQAPETLARGYQVF